MTAGCGCRWRFLRVRFTSRVAGHEIAVRPDTAPAVHVAGAPSVAPRPAERRCRSALLGRGWERPPISACLDRRRGGWSRTAPSSPPLRGRSQPAVRPGRVSSAASRRGDHLLADQGRGAPLAGVSMAIDTRGLPTSILRTLHWLFPPRCFETDAQRRVWTQPARHHTTAPTTQGKPAPCWLVHTAAILETSDLTPSVPLPSLTSEATPTTFRRQPGDPPLGFWFQLLRAGAAMPMQVASPSAYWLSAGI